MGNVGSLVFFGGGGHLWTTPETLRLALVSGGFDPASVPDLDPIARARESSAFRIGWTEREPVKIEVLSTSKTSIAFGVLYREEVVAGSEVRWHQRETVTYDATAGWSDPITPAGIELVRQAKLWQSHYNYGWIRAFFFGVLARNGFSIGNKGGIYFTTDQGLIDRMRLVVDACRTARSGNAVHLRTIGVSMTDTEGVAAVSDAAQVSLTEAVEDIVGQLAAWRERAKGRASTLERMLTDLGAIRDRAAGLAEALRFSTAEIEAAVSACAADVEAALDEAMSVRVEPAAEAPAEALVTPLEPAPVEPEPAPAPPTDPESEPEPAPRAKGRAPKAPNPWLAEDAPHPSVEELETMPARHLIAVASKRYGIRLAAKDGSRKSQIELATEILSHPSRAGMHVTA